MGGDGLPQGMALSFERLHALQERSRDRLRARTCPRLLMTVRLTPQIALEVVQARQQGLQLGQLRFWWVPKLWARELAVAGQHESVDPISLAQDADTASEAAHPGWVGHRHGHACRNDTVRDQLMVPSGRLDD